MKGGAGGGWFVAADSTLAHPSTIHLPQSGWEAARWYTSAWLVLDDSRWRVAGFLAAGAAPLTARAAVLHRWRCALLGAAVASANHRITIYNKRGEKKKTLTLKINKNRLFSLLQYHPLLLCFFFISLCNIFSCIIKNYKI